MVKVKAFSLFESVVAIAIITICIGIGAAIYTNVMRSQQPIMVVKGKEEMKRLFNELKTTKLYVNQSFDFDYYRIDQELEAYQGNAKVYEVHYKLFIQDKLMLNEAHLIYNDAQ